VGPGRRGFVGRLAPLKLAVSATVRLRRLHPDAVYKEDINQLLVPLPADTDPAESLAALLRELVPVPPSSNGASTVDDRAGVPVDAAAGSIERL
jgi:hypothetical protein